MTSNLLCTAAFLSTLTANITSPREARGQLRPPTLYETMQPVNHYGSPGFQRAIDEIVKEGNGFILTHAQTESFFHFPAKSVSNALQSTQNHKGRKKTHLTAWSPQNLMSGILASCISANRFRIKFELLLSVVKAVKQCCLKTSN